MGRVFLTHILALPTLWRRVSWPLCYRRVKEMGCVGVGEAELGVDKAQSRLVHPSQVPWQPTKAQLSGVHWVFPGLWGQSIGELSL